MTWLPNNGKQTGYSYEAEAAQLAKKRKLAEALMQMQGPDPNQVAGGMVVRNSPLAVLAPLISQQIGMKVDRDATRGEADLQEKRNAMLGEWLSKMPGTDPVQPVMPTTGFSTPERMATFTAAQTAGDEADRRAKLAWALQGGELGPMGQAVASRTVENLMPKAQDPYTLAPGAVRYDSNNRPIAQAPNRPSDSGAPVAIIGPDGKPRLVSRQDAIGKTPYDKPSTAVNVNLPENKYPNAFNEQLGKDDAATLQKYRASAESSTSMLKTLSELEKLNPTAMSGGGAQARAAVSNWLSGWTGVDVTDPAVLNDTQQYNAIVSKSVLDSLGGSLGAGTSNADVSFIQKTVPQLEYSADARQALIEYMGKRAKENIELYQRARAYGEQNGGLRGFDAISGAFPGSSPMPTGAADIDELVKRYTTPR